MSADTSYSLHVLPALRGVGERLMRDWLAITIGTHILAWRQLSRRELAHELAHVRQWHRNGLLFPLRYLVASIAAARSGTGWYRGNRYEREARSAENG